MRTERTEVQLLLRKRPAHPPDHSGHLLNAHRRRHNPFPTGGIGTFSKQFWRPHRARGTILLPESENTTSSSDSAAILVADDPDNTNTLGDAEDVFGVTTRNSVSAGQHNAPRLRLSTYDGTEVSLDCK